jgi:hypothetical protein
MLRSQKRRPTSGASRGLRRADATYHPPNQRHGVVGKRKNDVHRLRRLGARVDKQRLLGNPALDAWIGQQPEPKPTRPEAIRRLLDERLSHADQRRSDASLDRQIAEQKASVAEMPKHLEPSPKAAMAAMDKAVAQNDLST